MFSLLTRIAQFQCNLVDVLFYFCDIDPLCRHTSTTKLPFTNTVPLRYKFNKVKPNQNATDFHILIRCTINHELISVNYSKNIPEYKRVCFKNSFYSTEFINMCEQSVTQIRQNKMNYDDRKDRYPYIFNLDTYLRNSQRFLLEYIITKSTCSINLIEKKVSLVLSRNYYVAKLPL